MRIIKKILVIAVIIILVSALFGIQSTGQKARVLAYGSVHSVYCSPKELPASGGTVTVYVSISVSVPVNNVWLHINGRSYSTGYSSGGTDSTTVSASTPISSDMLNKSISVTVNAEVAGGGWQRIGSGSFTVKTKEEVYFNTEQSVTPEKEVYYVGETVNLHSVFKSTTSSVAKNFTVYYYYLREGDDKVTDITYEALGDVDGKGSIEHDFSYTFVEDDVGYHKLGSVIKYSVDGTPGSKWNNMVGFDVKPAYEAPEPIVTPTLKPTEAPAEETVELFFTVSAKAKETEVEPGSDATFELEVYNGSLVDINSLEIYCDGERLITYRNIQKGTSKTIHIDRTINESQDVYFELLAQSGDLSYVDYTNSIWIEVEENKSYDDSDANIVPNKNIPSRNAEMILLGAVIAAVVVFAAMMICVVVLIVKKAK